MADGRSGAFAREACYNGSKVAASNFRGRNSIGEAGGGPGSVPVVIVGAGLTGLSAAWHVDRPFLLAERAAQVGGKARSHRREGHTFDVTGHWLHLRDDRVRAWVGALCRDQEWVEVDRRTSVHSHGARLEFPFQANLFGLPAEVVHECLVGFVEARERAARGASDPTTFEEFTIARFGAGIARHFFLPYHTKLWGVHPDQWTHDWVTRFVPLPDVSQVIGGALGLPQRGLGYNATFTYPRAGGIDHLATALRAGVEASIATHASGSELRTGSELEELDVTGKRVKFSDRPDWLAYGVLVSTMPLPELIARTRGAPAEVVEASRQLRAVRWRYLDVATRAPPATRDHWIYVPEPRFPFFRVGVYSNVVEAMAPAGCGSLYVELTDREHEPKLAEVAAGLVEIGAIADVEDLLFCELRDVDDAYVVFDHAHARATRTILDWLDEVCVHSCGRYGAWTYNAMEDCLLAGMSAARWAQERIGA